MPNLPSKGFAVSGPSGEQLTFVNPYVSDAAGVALLPIEAWASGPNGVPVLIWALNSSTATGVSASYSGTTQAVTVAWSVSGSVAAESWQITRADFSVAGNVAPGAVSFVDNDPRALTGSYKVQAIFGDGTGAQVASNSLALAAAPGTVTGTWSASQRGWSLAWSAPSYGRPDSYAIFANGVQVGSVAGNVTTWVHSWVTPSTATTYEVRAVLTGTMGAASTVVKTTGNGSVGSLNGTMSGEYFSDLWAMTLTWTVPAYGTPDSYTIYNDGAQIGTAAGSATSFKTVPDAGSVHTYTVRANYTNVGAYDAATVESVPASYVLEMKVTTNPGGPRIEWHAPPGNWTGFEVEIVNNPVTWISQGPFSFGGATQHYYIDVPGLIAAYNTFARVRAYSAGGWSGYVLAGPFNPGVFGVYNGAPV